MTDKMQQPTVVIAGVGIRLSNSGNLTGIGVLPKWCQTLFTPPVGPESTTLICPSCRAQVSTRVEHNSTTKTHIMALLLCMFCCLPCVCVPYCCDSCRNADHYCPNCNAFIGSHQN